MVKEIQMNDHDIRVNIHKKILMRHHKNNNTLVIDELGLKNGDCRADIAVVNGCLCGFEIKSDSDSLNRLRNQVDIYDAVFDYSTIIVGEKHFPKVMNYISDWWGIQVCTKGSIGGVNFYFERKAQKNLESDPYSIAQFLWKEEVVEILLNKGIGNKEIRRPKAELYQILCSILTKSDLNKMVRQFLKKRTNWRDRKRLFQYDDLFRSSSM
jgi:hypothetical protein